MCAIFGVIGPDNAAGLTALGLHGNQHRARDYAGIVSSDGLRFNRIAGKGIAREVFTEEKLDQLPGTVALGHLRYPTVTDDLTKENIQPIVGAYLKMPIAVAHNGNLTNIEEWKRIISPAALSTSMDTEYILRFLEGRGRGNLELDICRLFSLLRGSFALGILLPDRLIAIRDKSGNRPLSIGAFRDGGYCISSETVAFPCVGATHLFDVEPGTMVTLERGDVTVKRFAEPEEHRCRFESIYYSHPDSTVFSESVMWFRRTIGNELEKLFPVRDADIVVGIPDAAIDMALGYATHGHSGRYFPVIHRSHYVGRTFIMPTQTRRDAEVSQKFTFNAEEIMGKSIVVVDDSIVRGTTIPKIVLTLRELGAKKVHVRIGSPPIVHPCIYGINTPRWDELIAATLTSQQICKKINADSLEFLPLGVLKEISRAVSGDAEKFCFSCMTGQYW